ncbi:MAG: hypothetical protein ACSW8G_07385, partial [Bacillota bacterium]
MNTTDEKKKKAAAIAVSAAMLAGGAAAATDMQSDENAYLTALNPKPVVQMIDDNASDQTVIQDEDSQKKVQQNQGNQTLAKGLLAPFYAAGTAIMKLGEMFLAGVLSPVLLAIVNWLIMAAVVLGILAACLKIAFPNIPLRKMLTKRGIIFVLAVTAAFCLACAIIPVIWPEAGIWVFIIKAAGALAIILMIFATVMKVLGR